MMIFLEFVFGLPSELVGFLLHLSKSVKNLL